MSTWMGRCVAGVVAAALVVAACGADSDLEAAGGVEPGSGVVGVCDLFVELQEADQGLGASLTRNFDAWDAYAISWRHLMGRLRLPLRDEASDLAREARVATRVLERAEIGLLQDPWTPEEVAAGRSLADAASGLCDVTLDGGFLASALG